MWLKHLQHMVIHNIKDKKHAFFDPAHKIPKEFWNHSNCTEIQKQHFLNQFRCFKLWLQVSRGEKSEQSDINQASESPLPLAIIDQSWAKPSQSHCDTGVSSIEAQNL